MTSERKGEIYIFFETLLWALFPVVSIISFNKIPSLYALAYGSLFSGLFFVPMILYKKSWNEFKNILLWKYSLGVVFFIGILYYGLYFIGLESTTAGNASIIATFEIFTSFVFFNLIRKEFFSLDHKIGSLLMISGAIIILAPNFTYIRIGDFLVLLATFFSPFGNLYQQKAKNIASSETILFLRNTLSGIAFFVFIYLFGIHTTKENLISSMPYLLLNGLLILGLSKLFWIEAISRMSVTKAISLNSMAPFITFIVAFFVFHQHPTVWQVSAMIPLFLGILLLTNNLKLPKTLQ